MATVVPIILFPRFTTLAGTGFSWTLPVDVQGFESVRLNAWRRAVIGTSASAQFELEVSNDKDVWSSKITGWDPGADTEDQRDAEFSERYMRAGVYLDGTVDHVIASLYLFGELVPREG